MKTVTCTFNPLTHKVVPIEPNDDWQKRLASGYCEWDTARDAIIDVIASAPEYPADARWISVDERLPLEDDGTVAVKLNDGSILTAWATYWHGASRRFSGWNHPFNIDDAVVTHWAMLPPAPEGV